MKENSLWQWTVLHPKNTSQDPPQKAKSTHSSATHTSVILKDLKGKNYSELNWEISSFGVYYGSSFIAGFILRNLTYLSEAPKWNSCLFLKSTNLFICRIENSLWVFRELLEGTWVTGNHKEKKMLNTSHSFSLWCKTMCTQSTFLGYSCAPGNLIQNCPAWGEKTLGSRSASIGNEIW